MTLAARAALELVRDDVLLVAGRGPGTEGGRTSGDRMPILGGHDGAEDMMLGWPSMAPWRAAVPVPQSVALAASRLSQNPARRSASSLSAWFTPLHSSTALRVCRHQPTCQRRELCIPPWPHSDRHRIECSASRLALVLRAMGFGNPCRVTCRGRAGVVWRGSAAGFPVSFQASFPASFQLERIRWPWSSAGLPH